MHISLEIGASLIFAIIAAWVSIKVSTAKSEVKITALEKQVTEQETELKGVMLAIAARNEEMAGIHRQLEKLDGLKIEAKLASIETQLQHIATLLKGGVKNG